MFDFLFSQYKDYPTIDIVMELLGVALGFISAWLSKRDNIWVYPVGMASTAIFVILLLKYNLLGEVIINSYYFIMSAYGWYVWTRKIDPEHYTVVTETARKQWLMALAIFLTSAIGVYLVYLAFEKFEGTVSYIDMFTTGIFFAGMWLMARKKIEYWLVLLVGNIISVPLYFYKGLTFTSLSFIGLAAIAVMGYLAWKKILNKPHLTV